MLDGLPLSDIPRARVRKGVTSIPQDPLIYRGTVRFNTDPHSIHSDEDIISALKEVNIWGVLNERGGLDADMDTVGLSRGEQQLFCLSRAILAKPRVLILDEVTSSVDRAQEDKIVEMLYRNFEGTTILMVVHHLRMVRNFDKILVLSEGEIVEWEHPDTLMMVNSMFRRLLFTQEAADEAADETE
uniref:ABC transporter domain-containing protein n=1 Tax=Bionectria ochroleuca TaxID=29856 RepID=A0A8H7N4A6_BIOOC